VGIGVLEKSDILSGAGGSQRDTLTLVEVSTDKHALCDRELGRDPGVIAAVVELTDFCVGQGKSYTYIHSNGNEGWFEENLGSSRGETDQTGAQS
jgi:hypothetical protein